MKIFAFITLISLATCNNYTVGKYSLKETINIGNSYGIQQDNTFYLNKDLLKKTYKDKKFSLQNIGIKIIDQNANILKTTKGECSVGNLNSVNKLDELEIDSISNTDFLKTYVGLNESIHKTKYSILCFWSTYYPEKAIEENINFAKETKNKCDDCQILYLNADIYTELAKGLNLK